MTWWQRKEKVVDCSNNEGGRCSVVEWEAVTDAIGRRCNGRVSVDYLRKQCLAAVRVANWPVAYAELVQHVCGGVGFVGQTDGDSLRQRFRRQERLRNWVAESSSSLAERQDCGWQVMTLVEERRTGLLRNSVVSCQCRMSRDRCWFHRSRCGAISSASKR